MASIIHWATKDQAHDSAIYHGRRQKRTIFATSYGDALHAARCDWLGEATPNRPTGRFRLQMPIDHNRAAAAGKRKSRPRLKLSKQDLKLISNTQEVLVPIRLEIEVEHWKLRDTFTWNLKEPVVTPEQFAIHLCEDLILPIQHFSTPIVSAIKEQLEEYKLHEKFQGHLASHVIPPEEELLGDDIKMENTHHVQINQEIIANLQQQKEDSWWAHWRDRILRVDEQCSDPQQDPIHLQPDSKRIKLEPHVTPTIHQSSIKSRLIDQHDQNLKPEPAEGITVSMDMRDDELRIPINLDIISGNIHLTDRFEWEISEINNSPEEFVEIYANDLGLGGEFKTAIAHSIREQIETYVKSLALVEHHNGYPVPNDELRYAFLQRVTEPIRTGQVDDFTPFLNLLNAEELDRQEKEHDREARRKRRQTRSRRGITLPDRESQRTVRSIVPIQGLKMVIPYQNENEDLIVPMQPVAEPFAIEESAVEIPEPSDLPPKRHIPVSKEVHAPESQSGTPNKATGSRVSRRLRGATADVAPSGTPPKTNEFNPTIEKEDAPTPTNAGTPVPCPTNKKMPNKTESSTNATANKKPPPAGPRTRGINWESLGLHDPMVDGVWHCSNCGCPEQIAVGRRKGLGGKDTLCGECGRYMHRYKRNRPTIYNTSVDYHTSLKLEADKAKQAIADQAIVRKDKNKADNQNLATNQNSKKRKKEGRASLLPKSEQTRRSQDRAGSVPSSAKSPASRDSSPVVSVRSTNNGGSEKNLSRKRSRIHALSDAPPTTRAQKNLSKNLVVLDSPEEPDNSPESNSPTNVRSQTTSGSQPTKPSRVSSRRSSTKTDKIGVKKNSDKNDNDNHDPAGSKSPPTIATRLENRRRKELRSREQSEKIKNGSKSVEEERAGTQLPPAVSRSGSVSGSAAGGKQDMKNEQRRSTTNGRVPPSIGTARKIEAPQWMTLALQNIKESYPSDRVELVPKPKRETLGPGQPPIIVGCDWRLKCLDCPGKLYTVGPGESFTNFDVHLKNRQHRQKVEDRLNGKAQVSPTGSSQNQPEISPTGSSNQHAHGSSSTTQPPQISPTDGSEQPFQISPTDVAQSQIPPTNAALQISPTENSYQAHQVSLSNNLVSAGVSNSQYQPADWSSNMQRSEEMPFRHTEHGAVGLAQQLQLSTTATSSLPPITTTFAAAESVSPDLDNIPHQLRKHNGEQSADRSPRSKGRVAAPSSIDAVALQDDNSVGSIERRQGLVQQDDHAEAFPITTTLTTNRPDNRSSQDTSDEPHGFPPQPFPQLSASVPAADPSEPRLVGRPELPAKPMTNTDGTGHLSSSGFAAPGLSSSQGAAPILAGPAAHLPLPHRQLTTGTPHHPHPHPYANHHHYIQHGFHGHVNPSSALQPSVPSNTPPTTSSCSSIPVPIRHPPPPHPLVHPLPKKPTFD